MFAVADAVLQTTAEILALGMAVRSKWITHCRGTLTTVLNVVLHGDAVTLAMADAPSKATLPSHVLGIFTTTSRMINLRIHDVVARFSKLGPLVFLSTSSTPCGSSPKNGRAVVGRRAKVSPFRIAEHRQVP